MYPEGPSTIPERLSALQHLVRSRAEAMGLTSLCGLQWYHPSLRWEVRGRLIEILLVLCPVHRDVTLLNGM